MDRKRARLHKRHNLLQSATLIGAMLAQLGLVGWVLAGTSGVVWALLAGAAVLALSPRVPPGLVLRMYAARPISRRQSPWLHKLVEELSRRAGLRAVPQLCHIPSRLLNAFTVGGRSQAAVCLTDGLLHELDPHELAGVLAHELSHIRNQDMGAMGLADLLSRLTAVLATAGQLLILLSLPFVLASQAQLPWLAALVLMAAPAVSALLQLAFSRTRELDADLDAARLTGDPAGLASALRKLEYRSGGWLSQVLLPGRRVPDPSLLRTHPATAERVQRLMSLVSAAPAPRLPLAVSGPPFELVLVRQARTPRWRPGGLWY
jgi:heat shock protein HtpX